MKALLFWWLQHQAFYRQMHEDAIKKIANASKSESFADVGCGPGLMASLAATKGYRVKGYDSDYTVIQLAKLLHVFNKNIAFKCEDVMKVNKKYHVISATSLLSVVGNREEVLKKLVSMLHDKDSVLMLIEPTSHLSVKNVFTKIDNVKSFYYYKGLLLWAKAREHKHINEKVFYDTMDTIKYEHEYLLEGMVCVTYIKSV